MILWLVLAQLNMNLNRQPIMVKDEGVAQSATRADTINCSGAGVTCTQVGTTMSITVPGGGSAAAPPVDGGYLTWNAGSTGSTNERVVSAGNYTVVDNATAGQTQIDWQHGLTCSAGQALTSSGTTAMQCTSTITASDVACAGTCVADAEISAVSGAKVSGAVATASALAADPADCSANQYATAINSAGVLTCTQVGTNQLSGTVSDAQLANNYSGVGACGANQWVSTLNDNASPTCSQPAFTGISGTVSISQGGTTETASTEDAVLVGSSTTDWQAKVLPSCSNGTTSKLLYDSSTNTFSCGTDQTGGAGSSNFVEVEVDFGTSGADIASTTVTGQSWVTATSKILCAPTTMASTDRSDGVEDALIEGLVVTVDSRVASTGFRVLAHPRMGIAYRKFTFHCTGG